MAEETEEFVLTTTGPGGSPYRVQWNRSTGAVKALGKEGWVDCGSTRDSAGRKLCNDNTDERDYAELLARNRLSTRELTGCIIATACASLQPIDERVNALRRVRDTGISSDPTIRDFFHVFWSRYYEWSPGVARIAAADPAVAQHIRWGFLEPWLAWMEYASSVGRRSVDDMSDAEARELLGSLERNLREWIAQIPSLMEGKIPDDSGTVFDAFDRFSKLAHESLEASRKSK